MKCPLVAVKVNDHKNSFCWFCQRPIQLKAPLFIAEVEKSVPVNFHQDCYDEWEYEFYTKNKLYPDQA